MIQAFLKKTRKVSSNLTYNLKELENGQIKPKVSRRKEIIQIREEINRDFKSNRKKLKNKSKS